MPDNPKRVGAVICERTRLEGQPHEQKAVGTGEIERLEAQMALVSIGYKAVALPGTEKWFDDQTGVMKNIHGKIDSRSEGLGGLYTSGWLKRGANGIIATNIPDAKDTVSTILEDLDALKSHQLLRGDIRELCFERGVDVVAWEGYKKIEQAEIRNKRTELQPREKITNITTMLKEAQQ